MTELETRADKINWDQLLAEVTASLAHLRLAWRTTESGGNPALHEMMVASLYLPCISLLAEFCASVEVEIEKKP